MRVLRLVWIAAYLLLLTSFTGCHATTQAPAAVASYSLRAEAGSVLGRHAIGALAASPADHSGLHLLADAQAALDARIALIDRAERSVDVQYYILRPDQAGHAVLAVLVRAAQRGVRVRLLLDDWGARPPDAQLADLAARPHFEVRVFNPLINARWPLLSMLLDFGQAQRRMHNKLLVADGFVAIVGGRNVGDEYFENRRELAFADVDALVIGPVVAELATGFDLYWNDGLAAAVHPVSQGPEDGSGAPAMPAPQRPRTDFGERLQAGTLRYFVGPASAVHDLPDKANANARADARTGLGEALALHMGDVGSSLLIVSPYFVPGEQGVKQLVQMAQRGVKVTIVTNSLAATDVPAVHAGYARYRKALLHAGVELYELRGDKARRADRHLKTGSSRVSLHAKVMVVDRSRTFIGSMNIDPRSMHLNTENGVVLESDEMSRTLAEGIARDLQDDAWQVELEAQELRWKGRQDGMAVIHRSEPLAGLWLRLGTRLLSLLPIERLL